MKPTRSLALRSERLTELSSDEMRSVNGGTLYTDLGCFTVRILSAVEASFCECVTRTCW